MIEDPEPIDPDDYEALDEMLTNVSDYSLAGHIVGVTTKDEQIQMLANSWSLLRSIADGVGSIAMVLERLGKGEKAEQWCQSAAEELSKYVEMIEKVVPTAVTSEDD